MTRGRQLLEELQRLYRLLHDEEQQAVNDVLRQVASALPSDEMLAAAEG